MKKLLILALISMTTFVYAQENFYCPSEIYCSIDHKINRVRCKMEKIEPDIWQESIGNTTGTIRLTYIDFKRDFKGDDGYSCVYVSGKYGTIIHPKIEYNIVPDMQKDSRWVAIGGKNSDKAKCGSYLSPISSSKDCPFKVDSSLLLVNTLDMNPLWAVINNWSVEAYHVGKQYYPDIQHFSFVSKIKFSIVHSFCKNEKYCKMNLNFEVDRKRYHDGCIWVDMDNNMTIFDITQPKDSSFKIVKIGNNAVEIKVINKR